MGNIRISNVVRKSNLFTKYKEGKNLNCVNKKNTKKHFFTAETKKN